MKTKTKNFTLLFTILLITFLFGCNTKSGEVEQLEKENQILNEKYQQQLIASRLATKQVDSLQTIVYDLELKIQKMQGDLPAYRATTADEKAIETLVKNLQKGWEEVLETNDTNKLLQYFLPKFTTSSVRVNTNNIPSVQRSNNATFEDHLMELAQAVGVTISFGQTKFLYTEIKGDIFVTSYRTKIRVYHDNKEISTNSVVTQLAGQRSDDGWKVGNYNWVNFNY